jgi:DNA polymerase-3 subunit epsilon
MTLPVLPTYYYLDHFTEMLSFVETTYGVMLEPEHHGFIGLFRALAKDEQCLLIRMINRRGEIFAKHALYYGEIGDTRAAIDTLRRKSLLRSLCEDDYTCWLATMKKDTLHAVAVAAGRQDVRASWPKAKLLCFVRDHVPFALAAELALADDYVVLANNEPVAFLLYLYFGKTFVDLKSFALRDLGVIRVNDAAGFKARFGDAAEAKACFFYSRWLDRLSVPSLPLYLEAAAALKEGPIDGGDYARSLRERAGYDVALFLEKQKHTSFAIELYSLIASPECNERLARLLYNEGRKDEAKSLLERMIDDPGSDEEHLFAADFYARKFDRQRTGLCTALLRAGRTITIDENHRGNPEAGVAGTLRRDGHKVYHTENLLWHNLFGLLFWDELFESGQLHSGFDWLPQCLRNKSFASLFAGQIEEKLQAIRARQALPLLLKTVAARYGKPNGVFSWNYLNVEALSDLLALACPQAVASIVELMCRDFLALRDGFPDLMSVKDGQVRFTEVKAEGDVVRRNQLTRLRQLQAAGLPSEICRVDYRFDPEQIYVVVDIETTGGWAPSDRITEIGAVKMRNHEIIAEWQTLINPQRLIPASITGLTGITNEMVRDAPLFAEIADDFIAFMDDAVFVAHNVNFDYGFISKEYERLERRFRFPKFCTCAGMRRAYPGHKSYSLGKLCVLYEIDLVNHHRAMCDAKAAASLLNLINRKREGTHLKKAA